MSINDYRPKELCEHRKAVSDEKNDTEDLTFTNAEKKNQMSVKHVKAHRKLESINEARALAVELAEVWEEC